MAVWAVGDIHGCHGALERLLAELRFDPARDRLLATGDLVSRGPAPHKVLRLLRSLGEAATAVLGNHDLSLLGCALGVSRPKKRTRFDLVLEAPDGTKLVEWLRLRPLLHVEESHPPPGSIGGGPGRGPDVLVHAGLLPGWTLPEAVERARRAEDALRGPSAPELLRAVAELKHGRFDPAKGVDAQVAAVAVLTMIRCVDARGRLDLDFADPPEKAPPDLVPWYEAPGRGAPGSTVVCGHWATAGLRLGRDRISLDSGCVYGGRLSAVRLEDRRVVWVPGWNPLKDEG